jgi:hypothetical protein
MNDTDLTLIFRKENQVLGANYLQIIIMMNDTGIASILRRFGIQHLCGPEHTKTYPFTSGTKILFLNFRENENVYGRCYGFWEISAFFAKTS